MQNLFKNVVIDLAPTFHPKSFFLYDIILLTQDFDDLFTFLDKPYVHKSKDLNSLLTDLYGGRWDVFFKDLLNFKPVSEGRPLSLFLSTDDYIVFLGKLVSSIYPELSVGHKARIIRAVCDDTRYIKSLKFSGDRKKVYLGFQPDDEKIMEAAAQEPANLPLGFAEGLYFDFIIGHHLHDPQRFFHRVFQSLKSISYQEFRINYMLGAENLRSLFSFEPDKSFTESMSQPFLKFSFDDAFEVKSFFSDPEGADVKEFIEKYGVSWIEDFHPYKPYLKEKVEDRFPEYVKVFRTEMLDERYLVSVCDNPDELKNLFTRISREPSFSQVFKFPLLAEWFRFRDEGVQVKIV
jgi:hypothetical protein